MKVQAPLQSLDHRAVARVRHAIELDSCLGPFLTRTLNLEAGSVCTLVSPSNTSDLYAWEVGGKFDRNPPERLGVDDIGETIVGLLIAEGIASKVSTVVSVDANARSTDPWLEKSKSRFALSNDSVLSVAFVDEGPEAVLQSIRLIRGSWNELSVWSTGYAPVWRASRPVLGPDDLERIAAGTQYLMVGVYDGESYLVWRRANL